jgi:hypothetical protein
MRCKLSTARSRVDLTPTKSASFSEEELDSCAMAEELVEETRLLSLSAVPEPLVFSTSGLETETLALSLSSSSSSSVVIPSSTPGSSSSRSSHFGLVPLGFSLTIEGGDRLIGFEPEPLALSWAELPSAELEPLALSLPEWSHSMRSLTGVCSSRTCCYLISMACSRRLPRFGSPAATWLPRGGEVSFCFAFLGGGSKSKLRRGSFPPDLLRTEREGDRLNGIACHHRWGIGRVSCSTQGKRWVPSKSWGPRLSCLSGSSRYRVRCGWPVRSGSFGTRDVPSCR